MNLRMAEALMRAALVRSFLYLCLFRFAFVLWRLLPRPAFMVTERVALEGLWDSFALLVVTTKPLLSAAALTWISMIKIQHVLGFEKLMKFSFKRLYRPRQPWC